MWDQGGGGFMTSNTPGSVGRTPGGGGGGRGRRTQNVVSVSISTLVKCPDEVLRVENVEVGMVVVVGQVRNVDLQATKSVYTIEDHTDSIQAVHFKDEGQEHVTPPVMENMYCRVVGAVSHSADSKHLMVYRIDPVDDRAEMDAHKLQIVHDKLKIRLATEKENAVINGNTVNNSSVSASLLATNTNNSSGINNAFSGSGSMSFGKAQYDAVFKLISSCPREEGLARDELISQLKGRFSNTEVEASLDFLSGEGHIYLTIDEDHFKAIE